jgi:large subunit ribosomal protein L7/L12
MAEEQKDEQKQQQQQTQPEQQKEEKPKEEKKEEKQEEQKEENREENSEEVEVPDKFKSLVEEIEKMSVADLAELVKILEKKFGVSSAPQVVAQAVPGGAPAGAAAGGGAGGEEKSAFNIELTAVGDKKIEVIKVVRDVTKKGLKESKDLVDAVEKGPQVVKENVKKEEAEEIKKKFEAAGAKVELK